MSLKLLVNNFEWTENSDEVVFELYVQYSEKLHELHTDLLLLPESMKIEKVEKFVSNLHDKKMIFYTYKKFQTGIIINEFFLKKIIE